MDGSMDKAHVSALIERYKIATVGAAAVLPLGVCAVLAVFRESVTSTTAALILVLVIVAAASTGVRMAGILAALSSGVWFDLFLTEPYGRLSIHDRDDIEATVLLVVIGAAVTEVALWGHRQQARAARRSGYLDGVLGTAEIVTLRHETPETLIEHVARQVNDVLDIDGCRFVAGPPLDPRTPLLDHQGLVSRRGRYLKADQAGLPTDDETALLVRRGDEILGHFLLNSAARIARPTVEQRKVAVLLADQVGAVIDSQGQAPSGSRASLT